MNFSINISRENDQTFVNGSYNDNGQIFIIRPTQIDNTLIEPIIAAIAPNSYIAGFVFTDGILYLDGVTFDGTYENVTYVGGLIYLHGLHNNIYYINNVATELDSVGSGDYNGLRYYYGQPANGILDGQLYNNGVLSTGYYNTTFYLNGQPTTLDSNGSGVWNDLFYSQGVLATGEHDGLLYENGYKMSGTYNGLLYQNGLPYTGIDVMSSFYINGLLTTLDYQGNGVWDGNEYNGGTRI